MSSCSIVIPAHDGVDLTRRCLETLLAQDLGGAEIVVVDDASTDGTAQALADYRDIRMIRNERNLGFAASCNAGVAAARGDEVVLLNNDTRPVDGWLEALLDHARRHPRAGIVGAKLLWPNGTIQHAGVVVTQTKNVRHVYVGFPGDHPAVNRSRPYQAVTAACMLVRRQLFDHLGGFDTAFLNGYEDVDLCLRAREQGHEVHYCHESVVHHLESSTRGRDPELDHANASLCLRRWGDKIVADDLDYYVRDGLVKLSYDHDSLRVSVDPLLGGALNGHHGQLEALLAARESQVFVLQRENAQLARGLPTKGSSRPAARGLAEKPPPEVSVIIAVDHGEPVSEVLSALANQTVAPERFEVRVVYREWQLPEEIDAGPLALTRVANGPFGGRAAAFNRGIREAEGELILLLVDDVFPQAGFLAAHLAAHAQDPRENMVAVGGAVFSERLRDTAFRRWLEDSGNLFGVPFTGEDPPPPGYFWCGNASLKRSFLLGGELFDERLSLLAWDDYELGRRLAERGMITRYVPDALAMHEHPITLAERRDVMQAAGVSAARFDAKYPPGHRWHTDTRVPRSLLRLEARAQWARVLHRLHGRERDAHAYFKRTLDAAFLRGYRAETDRLGAAVGRFP